jgi:hypothetical protein
MTATTTLMLGDEAEAAGLLGADLGGAAAH